MRPRHVMLLASLTLLAACAPGDGPGGVVVRWQFVDPSTGSQPDSCSTPRGSGWCCAQIQAATVGAPDLVYVDEMQLVLVPAARGGDGVSDGGAPVDFPCKSCVFACNALEHSTAFEVPPGDYLMSLRASRCGVPVGYSPPPLIRTVQRDALTNLNSIEILLPPSTRTRPTCDPAAVDMQ